MLSGVLNCVQLSRMVADGSTRRLSSEQSHWRKSWGGPFRSRWGQIVRQNPPQAPVAGQILRGVVGSRATDRPVGQQLGVMEPKKARYLPIPARSGQTGNGLRRDRPDFTLPARQSDEQALRKS